MNTPSKNDRIIMAINQYLDKGVSDINDISTVVRKENGYSSSLFSKAKRELMNTLVKKIKILKQCDYSNVTETEIDGELKSKLMIAIDCYLDKGVIQADDIFYKVYDEFDVAVNLVIIASKTQMDNYNNRLIILQGTMNMFHKHSYAYFAILEQNRCIFCKELKPKNE